MGGYQVSYPVLSRQGDILQELAREVDGYIERVDGVCRNLEEDLLADVRKNLHSLSRQLAESRAVLHTSGKILDICVESYSHVETASVQKVDAARAHNRDFYKNPVIVISNNSPVQIIQTHVSPAAAPVSPSPQSYTAAEIPAVPETVSIPDVPAPDAAIPNVPATEYFGTAADPLPDPSYISPSTDGYGDTGSVPTNTEISEQHAAAVPEGNPAAVVPPDVVPPTPAHTPSSPAEGGGFSGAAMAAGIAGGAAAGAGGLFGAQKLRAYLKERQKDVLEQEMPVLDLTSCEDQELEKLLEKARAEVAKYHKEDAAEDTEAE